MKRRVFALLALLMAVLLPCAVLADESGDTVTSDELLYNADFSLSSEAAELPAGWSLTSYEGSSAAYDYADSISQGIAIAAEDPDDVRVWQDVSVEPDTIYRLTGYIETQDVSDGQGASFSIDNYSVDGCYTYSNCFYGTTERTQVTFYFRTDTQQDTVRIAMRIGGYGMESSGMAYYSDLSLVQIGETDGYVVDLADTFVHGDSSSTAEETTTFLENGSAVFTAMLLATAVALLLGALLYTYFMRDGGTLLPDPKRPGIAVGIILIVLFVVRVILSVIFYGHPTDISCFMAWGNALISNGPAAFYTSGMFADYPPAYMYVCGLMALIANGLGLTYGSDGYSLLFKIPSILADIGMAYFVYRLAKKQGMKEGYALFLAGIIALNPATAFVSGAWGQIESILMMLLVLSFYLLQEEKPIAGGAVYGLAVLLKPQALMFGPILAVGYILEILRAEKKLKQLLKTAAAVVAAFAVIILLSLPFQGTQEFGWLISKYFGTATSYPYASIEAFNFPALLGDNWTRVESTVLGVPYTVWGPIFIAIGVIYGAFLLIRSHRNADGSVRKGSLYLAATAMMFIIFTFGYYMHERYLMPVLLLLLMAYLYEKDRRLLASFLLTTGSILLNVLAAMYIVDHQDMRGTYYNVITAIGSILTVGACGFTVYTATDLLLLGHKWSPAEAVRIRTSGKTTHAGTNAKGKDEGEYSILPSLKTDTSLHLSRFDIIACTALIVVYAITAVLNLGTTNSPQTYFESSKVGETVTIQFEGEQYISEYWVYSNISDDGQMLITTDSGEEAMYEETYDNMFRWEQDEAGFTASSITLTVYGGTIKVNEMAFIGEDGKPLAVTVVSADGSGANLFDEQDTVPEDPSYLNGMYFDELYHARTAYEHVNNLEPYENSHPPLGKLIIAIGILIFGMCPFGWRIMGTLFGIGMIPILYAFGKKLFKKSSHAFTLAFLFAFDFMHFTQTRIATIDVYAVFFILLMYYFMYEYITMNFFTDGLKRTLRPLALSGIFFGIGCACKWICIYAGGGLAVLFFTSLFTRYREYAAIRDGRASTGKLKSSRRPTAQERSAVEPFWNYTIKTLLWCCLFFVAIPLTIYIVSYMPYYIYEAGQTSGYGLGDALSSWWGYQKFMYSYHSGLNVTHPYQSSWYQWPFTVKPMWYYSGNNYVNDTVSTITASGNPAVWWVSSIGAVVLFVLRVSGKVKKDRALQIFCIGVLANYLPWVLVSRCTFIYHFFATVPFILMATVYLEMKGEERWPWMKWVRYAWLALALAFFILLYPGLSGYAVPSSWAAFIKTLPGGGLMYGA